MVTLTNGNLKVTLTNDNLNVTLTDSYLNQWLAYQIVTLTNNISTYQRSGRQTL